MINTCVVKRQAFGVVLISNNVSDSNLYAEPEAVGCTAQITQVQPLTQGRMNITAVGRERFKIKSFNREMPYLVGMVEMYPLVNDQPANLLQQTHQLRSQIENYVKVLRTTGQGQVDLRRLPVDPTALAFLGAVLLQELPSPEKQHLLEIKHISALLHRLAQLYQREIALLDVMLAPPENNDFRGLYSLS